jgi:hypothetical protein
LSDRLALSSAIEDAGIERSKAQRVASVIFDVRPDLDKAGGSVLQAHQLSEIGRSLDAIRSLLLQILQAVQR